VSCRTEVLIPGFPGSYGLLASGEAIDRAVIFVHGFLGNSNSTWLSFQELIGDYEWWDRADVYFFQYESFRRSISRSADQFLGFLDSVWSPADGFPVVPEDPLPPWLAETVSEIRITVPTTYSELLLVGHSLGGVVLRKAVLDKAKLASGSPRHAILEGALRLFSPALLGARPAGLRSFILQQGGFGRWAQAILKTSPSYNELTTNLTLLDTIQRGTERRARDAPAPHAFAADVLWADDEEVVSDGEYDCDRNRGRMKGKTHTSVCKPSPTYIEPLGFVENGHL
jgi:pimeloyl-ACP methyl ester carboxylesterase